LICRKGYPTRAKVFKTKAEAWSKITESELVRGAFVTRKKAGNTTRSEASGQYPGQYLKEVTAMQKGLT
jgi:hypothetical protein